MQEEDGQTERATHRYLAVAGFVIDARPWERHTSISMNILICAFGCSIILDIQSESILKVVILRCNPLCKDNLVAVRVYHLEENMVACN